MDKKKIYHVVHGPYQKSEYIAAGSMIEALEYVGKIYPNDNIISINCVIEEYVEL